MKTKFQLYRSLVLSIFLYGCETWTLNAASQKQCFRKILHISYRDHQTNTTVQDEVRQIVGQYEPLLTTVKRRKLIWFGHVSSVPSRTVPIQNHYAGYCPRTEMEGAAEKNMAIIHPCSFA